MSQVLRPASVLIFVIAICLFLHELMFIHPGRQLPVADKDHQVIGEVWIPHSSDLKAYGLLVALAGLQMWSILAITRKNQKHDA
jgi:hypothetical protein